MTVLCRGLVKGAHQSLDVGLELGDFSGFRVAEQRTGNTVLVWDYLGLHPLAQREAKYRNEQPSPEQRETDRRFFAIVTALTGAVHVTLADTTWGLSTRLWDTLTVVLDEHTSAHRPGTRTR
ncbi:hypothetical protein [Streptomyces sp. CAU 1734]|uniref:hypothetical protein n=1 Tax=Streptomyces sp. CAU 1734 TaxID=3140360 RepID=UPI003260A180